MSKSKVLGNSLTIFISSVGTDAREVERNFAEHVEEFISLVRNTAQGCVPLCVDIKEFRDVESCRAGIKVEMGNSHVEQVAVVRLQRALTRNVGEVFGDHLKRTDSYWIQCLHEQTVDQPQKDWTAPPGQEDRSLPDTPSTHITDSIFETIMHAHESEE